MTFIAEYGLGSPNLVQIGITPGGQVQYLTGFAVATIILLSTATTGI